MKSLSVAIQIKATEQYFPVVLIIVFYKMVLILKSVDVIANHNHSNESYWAAEHIVYWVVHDDDDVMVEIAYLWGCCSVLFLVIICLALGHAFISPGEVQYMTTFVVMIIFETSYSSSNIED